MTVAVVEQLEMIDIDHHQRQRLLPIGRAFPLVVELTVEAAPIGESGEAVKARQLLQVLVGDLQFLLAPGELARHVVECRGKRFELRQPGRIRCANAQIAAAEARGGARQRPDRPHDQLFAAEPSGEKNQRAKQRELQVSDGDLAVDPTVHDGLVQAHGKPRPGPGHPHIDKNAPHPVEAVDRHRAFVVGKHVLRQGMIGKVLAEESFEVGGTGDQRAAAVDQHHGGTGAMRGLRCEIADPLQIDRRQNDAIDRAVFRHRREGGNQAGHAVDAVDQVVAEREIARAHRLGKIGTVGDVQPNGARVGRTNNSAVSPGDAETAKPWNVAGQIGEHMTAVGRVERGPGVDAGDDLE